MTTATIRKTSITASESWMTHGRKGHAGNPGTCVACHAEQFDALLVCEPVTPTLTQAFKDPNLPVDTMIPVQYSTVPADVRRDAIRSLNMAIHGYAPKFRNRTPWTEVYGPLNTQGGCRFGCKLYARKRGAVVEFAVHHSLTYGHSHSPNAR